MAGMTYSEMQKIKADAAAELKAEDFARNKKLLVNQLKLVEAAKSILAAEEKKLSDLEDRIVQDEV